LHTREAEHDTHAFLRDAEAAGVRGVLHCFTGSHELAEAGLAAGWHVSFSGVITFRKFNDIALLNLVPANRLLVESDAPYLAPIPNRGKRNEPAWVASTLARLADARGCSVESLAKQTLTNTRNFFNLEMRNEDRVTNVLR
jgi:TatD DNase family protein